MTFTLAHLSDLHMALRPRLTQLVSKRGLGFINWHRKRKYIHRRDVLDAVTRDLKTQPTDHIAVTGDLVNLSLPIEYERARTWLDALGPPRDVTVIPGNHDCYVRKVADAPQTYWSDYMRGDDGSMGFPFVRWRDGVALIALSTGVPTGPFMATGRLGHAQIEGLAAALDAHAHLFRAVLVHHPPLTPPHRALRRMIDGEEFRRVLAEKGAELVLHGHDHRRAVLWLDGPGASKIPAVGVPSASAQHAHGDEDGAGYHLFQISAAAEAGRRWRCEMIARQRAADGSISETERLALI